MKTRDVRLDDFLSFDLPRLRTMDQAPRCGWLHHSKYGFDTSHHHSAMTPVTLLEFSTDSLPACSVNQVGFSADHKWRVRSTCDFSNVVDVRIFDAQLRRVVV
jgi:hypothetical protein